MNAPRLRQRVVPVFAGLLALHAAPALTGGQVPAEPISIGAEPQFFVDDYLIDNHWPLKKGQRNAELTRVFHEPSRHSADPVVRADFRLELRELKPGQKEVIRIVGSDPGMMGNLMVVKEDERFRMWFDSNRLVPRNDARGGNAWLQRVGYAESLDGVQWKFPPLGVVDVDGSKQNSLVGSERVHVPMLIENVPEKHRRGYKYIFVVLSKEPRRGGITLVGSQDGVRWDWAGSMVIAHIHSDHYNCIVYDEKREEFVMYLRAKDRYLAHRHDLHAADLNPSEGNQVDLYEGESRRVARMSSKQLWTDWLAEGRIQNVLLPDALDAADGFTRFYLMPVVRRFGIYWGYLTRLRHDLGAMDVELVTSRDGFFFQRQPERPRLLSVGARGSWDDGLVFPGVGWVESGDEWWIYYRGDDEDHKGPERNSATGLLKLRKEGFLSLRGPKTGAVVATRELIWPGGDLQLNLDARGEAKVMVSTARREPIPGFGYSQSPALRTSSVAHRVTWGERSLDDLKGQTVRLEFRLQDADLYTFRAVPR